MAECSPLSAIDSSSRANNYERLESNIGEGTYGKVHKAKCIRTGKIVAIKNIKSNTLVDGIHFTALREIKIMRGVQHPNVMDLMDVYIEGGNLSLVMPFMATDLRHVMEDPSISSLITESHIKCIVQQMTRGIEALHANWFLHRDLTPGNVLIDDKGVVKVGDFGLSRPFASPDKKLTPTCVTLWYRPPELFYGATAYSGKVDIWSIGCIFGQLLNNKAVFMGTSDLDMLVKIFTLVGTPNEKNWKDAQHLPTYMEFSEFEGSDFAETFPTAKAGALALLKKILVLDPNARPTATDILADEWFKSIPKTCTPGELPLWHKKQRIA